MALVELPRTPLPWFDEILLVSAARSATMSHPAVPSVLSSFPHTMRSDLFYGPLCFWIGSASLKLFGLSLWSWRLLGWLAGVAVVLESAWLILQLTGSKGYAAMGALMVSLSPAMGSAMTSGRTDTITVAFELFAFCLMFIGNSVVKSVLAGLAFAAAVLSTPRAHPMAVCFFLVLICYAAIRKDTSRLRNLCLAASTALLSVVAWTFSAGLNPVSWYRMLLRATSGDKINASPLLGGSWGHFSLEPLALILPAGLAVWLIMWAFRRGEKRSLGPTGELLAVLLANAALYMTVTSRALAYQMFWLVPLISAAVATTSRYAEMNHPKRPSMVYVLLATILIAGVLRIGKVTEVITSWTARDPQPLKAFVCTKVPENSRVFGPVGLYYYAVEECSSQYLYAGNWTASGLQSPLDPSTPTYYPGDFLLWPADSQPPGGEALKEIAHFHVQVDADSPHSTLSKLIRHEFPFTGGYPESVLYEVK
jgi:4-amino-4-deoxy-L-arabinose transferase-like glycosyltransferase